MFLFHMESNDIFRNKQIPSIGEYSYLILQNLDRNSALCRDKKHRKTSKPNLMSNNESTVFTPLALIPTVHIRSMSLSPSIPPSLPPPLCIITPSLERNSPRLCTKYVHTYVVGSIYG